MGCFIVFRRVVSDAQTAFTIGFCSPYLCLISCEILLAKPLEKRGGGVVAACDMQAGGTPAGRLVSWAPGGEPGHTCTSVGGACLNFGHL